MLCKKNVKKKQEESRILSCSLISCFTKQRHKHRERKKKHTQTHTTQEDDRERKDYIT
jgi:hypothetical protein